MNIEWMNRTTDKTVENILTKYLQVRSSSMLLLTKQQRAKKQHLSGVCRWRRFQKDLRWSSPGWRKTKIVKLWEKKKFFFFFVSKFLYFLLFCYFLSLFLSLMPCFFFFRFFYFCFGFLLMLFSCNFKNFRTDTILIWTFFFFFSFFVLFFCYLYFVLNQLM